MMIINSYDEYNTLKSRMELEDYVLTPIFRDLYYHPVENSILCVGITFIAQPPETYVVSISHEDAMTFPFPTGAAKRYTSKSKLLDGDAFDIFSMLYINNVELPNIENHFKSHIRDTHAQFRTMRDVNRIVPISIWSSVLRDYNNELVDLVLKYDHTTFTKPFRDMQSMLDTLQEIESAGICVDDAYFENKSLGAFKSNMLYSEYNPYTSTGRPSNRFGGVNFSALNKSDGTRDHFISRYENGRLVYIDFEAYHLRLIADDLGVQLPSGSIHTELGKIYFDTDEITSELYEESKRKTFEIIYGMNHTTHGIELFEKINKSRQRYTGDTITLPSGISTTVDSPNPSKLFNYYVQSLEVVKTIPKLQAVLELLKNTNNHLILYTYDSILIDMEHPDQDMIVQIVDIFEENGKFPVRTKIGKTYGEIS